MSILEHSNFFTNNRTFTSCFCRDNVKIRTLILTQWFKDLLHHWPLSVLLNDKPVSKRHQLQHFRCTRIKGAFTSCPTKLLINISFAPFLAHLLKIHPFRQTLTAPFILPISRKNNPEVRHNYRPRVLENTHPLTDQSRCKIANYSTFFRQGNCFPKNARLFKQRKNLWIPSSDEITIGY